MKWSDFTIARAACAYFFICPGLAYGLFTSRLPALKSQTGADEAQIGLILLSLGLSSVVALSCSGWLIARFGSALILRIGSLVLVLATVLCSLAADPVQLGLTCILVGLGMGLADVSMNTQGIQIERRYASPCMSLMHASYSLGGVLGSLTGAMFASLDLSPFTNVAGVLGFYTCLRFWAAPRLMEDSAPDSKIQSPTGKHSLPLFVFLCGLLSMIAYAVEGSVAEWGSLLLHTVKGATEQTAALVFAAFSTTTVLCRIFGDRLRSYWGDFILALGGSVLALCGMSAVLFFNNPAACLVGYAFMGAGLSPIVPILFSRAGSYPGVSAGKASATVSLLSYSGLLFFPPLLGFVAHQKGLADALLIVLAACVILASGTFLLRKKTK